MLEIDKKVAKTINTHYDDEIFATVQTLMNAHSEMDGKTFYKYFYPDYAGSEMKWKTYVAGKFIDFRDNLDYFLANLDSKRKLIFCSGLRAYAVDRVERFERILKESDEIVERLNKESEVAK